MFSIAVSKTSMGSLARLFLDGLKSIINDLLGNTLLAVEHNAVDERVTRTEL